MSGIAATPPPAAESDSADKSGKVRSPDTATGSTLTGSPFSEKKEESDLEGRSPGTGVRLQLEGVLDGAQTKSLDDAKEEILNKFFDDKGNYKYIYFIEDSESDSESDSKKESEAGQTGGAEPPEEAKYESIVVAYKASLTPDDKNALLGDDLGADVAETIQLILSGKNNLAMLGLKREHWEVPNPTQQCITAGIPPRTPCWLCGNPVNMGHGGAIIKRKRMSVCNPDDNQYECEHVLPGVFMLFLKKMINVTLEPEGTDKAKEAKLYDSSCHICNTTKSDGVYIRAKWVGGGSAAAAAAAGKKLEFSPHNEKIMVDILTFILSTRIGQTVELKRYTEGESGPSTGRESAIAKNAARAAALQTTIQEDKDKKPICSNRDAVVSYVAKMSGRVRVISRSTFTSITAVAELENPDTLRRITAALPGIEEPDLTAAAKSAEAAVAFTIAPRFNNLTRAVIEQITPDEITAATQIVFDPPTHIDMRMFNFLTTGMGENKTFDKLFKVPEPPAPSALPGVAAAAAAAAAVVGLAPASSGPAAVEAPPRISDAKEHLAALGAAGIPMTINREKAWAWIRTRYMEIWTRMNKLCDILNRDHKQIEASVRSLAAQPLLTADDIDTLDAWSKVPTAAAARGKRARTGAGGMSFTIRRRSETRQTKKNRRRKVIGTPIDDNQVSGTMMDVEMEGGGPGDEEEDRGYSTVESDAIRIPLGKKLKKEDVGRLAAIHETPNPEDDWTDALIQELSYTTKDDEMFTPKYVDLMETTEDGEEIITRTFLDEYGNPKGEPKILDNTLEGGGTGKKWGRNPTPTEGPARQRRRTDLTLDDLKRTPEQKRIAEQIVDTVMTPGKEGITAAMDSVTEIIKRLRPDFKGADRSLFEEGTVTEQCEGVLGTQGNVVGEICWLCGFAMNMYEVEGTGKTNGVDTKDLNTYMSQPSLDRASCEHKLPIKAAHYFQLMYQKLSKRNGQMSADQFERIKTLYGNAHAFCNYVKSEDLFLESVLGVKTFGEFKVNFIRIAGVNRPPTGISEDGYLKRLLMSVRKRDSSTKAISGLLSGNRFYYWGSQVTRMTGTGATHYRNGVMYRIHKMEDFNQAVASQYVNPRPTQTVARDDPGVNIPYTEFKSPSNKTVRKWLYEQATNIVGGLNELRVLLNSERDKLYTEGLQVINRKPFRENVEWWGLVVPYIKANPTEGEDFKHGLHLPLKDQIPEPKYKKPQLVWQPGQLGPQASGETDRITYDDDAAVSRMPSATAPATPPPPPAPQYDDNELLNVERKPLDESFNYDELLQLPGYTNTQGGGGGGRVSVIIRRRSETRQTKKNRRRKVIEVSV